MSAAILTKIKNMRSQLDEMESEVKDFADLNPNKTQEREPSSTQEAINARPQDVKPSKKSSTIKMMAASLRRSM